MEDNKQIFKCEHCGKEYTRADFYHKHMEKEHSAGTEAINAVISILDNTEKKVDDYINKEINELKKLYKIVFVNQHGKIIRKKYGVFQCNNCGRKFETKFYAEKHNCKIR